MRGYLGSHSNPSPTPHAMASVEAHVENRIVHRLPWWVLRSALAGPQRRSATSVPDTRTTVETLLLDRVPGLNRETASCVVEIRSSSTNCSSIFHLPSAKQFVRLHIVLSGDHNVTHVPTRLPAPYVTLSTVPTPIHRRSIFTFVAPI